MNKNDLRTKMQSGFLEAAPDVYEAVLKAAEQNKQMLKHEESQKAEGYVDGGIGEDSGIEQIVSRKGSVIWGNFSKYALSACAGFALFIVCLFGIVGKNQDNIYVVLDINPSVQIEMNDSLQVKELQGLNQDGKDVIQTIGLKRKQPLLQTVDALVESAVDGSYLHEGGGILVTISATDQQLYDELKDEMASGIDKKLQKMGVSGVITAFQRADGSSAKAGRQLLEEELAGKYGIDKEKLLQMPVIELIQYYQECASVKLELSPDSEKHLSDASEEKNREQEKKDSQEKEREKTGVTEKWKDADKNKTDSKQKEDKVKNMQPKKEEAENKKKTGQDASSQASGHDVGSGNGTQQQNPKPSAQPSREPASQPEPPVQPQPEPPSQPENPPQDGNEQEKNPGSGDDKQNNGKKDEIDDKENSIKKDNNSKENNNKDNNNKHNNNKDNSNKDNNKDNSNKDNNKKDNNNKDNSEKDNNNKDNSKKDSNNNNNKDKNSGKGGKEA